MGELQPEQTRTLTIGVCMHAQSLQSCLILCDPPWTVAHQAPSVHGILQARILEWAAISFCRGSSQPGIKTMSLARLLCCRQILYLLSYQESRYHESCLSNYHLLAKTPVLGSWLCWLSFQWGQSWEGNVSHSDWRYVIYLTWAEFPPHFTCRNQCYTQDMVNLGTSRPSSPDRFSNHRLPQSLLQSSWTGRLMERGFEYCL